MRDQTYSESFVARGRSGGDAVGGLINDLSFSMKPPRQLSQSHALKHYQAARKLKRLFSLGAAPNIAVKVGSGEHDDQRQVGMQLVEAADRRGAAAGVERDQHIAAPLIVSLRNSHPMTELFEQRGPAQRGDAIAVVDAQRRGGDELDIHVVRLTGAGAKACPNIAPVRRVEVSPGVADQQR